MSSPFLAEIRIFGFNFAPRGWAICAGQILPISQNTALFSLLGVNYGGNGTTNFGLPNFQGNAAVSQGQSPGNTQRYVGETGGVTSVTLINAEMPSHSHDLNAATLSPPNAAQNVPTPTTTAMMGISNPGNAYASPTAAPVSNTLMSLQSIQLTGGNQPHNNRQPYLGMNFCIALQGIFPSRN